jgi:hypothetical protein
MFYASTQPAIAFGRRCQLIPHRSVGEVTTLLPSVRCWRLIDCFWAARCCMMIGPLATGRQSMTISDSFGMSAASGCPDALWFSGWDYPRFGDIRLSGRPRLNKHYMYVSAELLRRKTNKRRNHTDHVHQPEIKEARRRRGRRREKERNPRVTLGVRF